MWRKLDAEQIMVALCCGEKCKPGPNTGLCHRFDFENEAKRVMALLDKLEQGKPNTTVNEDSRDIASAIDTALQR
jgi:hypothetical protein